MKPIHLVLFAAEAAHHSIALNGFGGHVGHITHGDLNLLALLAKFLAGRSHQYGNQRQDRQQHKRQTPVHPQQVAKQEDHRHAFANHHLDGVGNGAGHHGHVVGNARDQVT